MMGGRKKGASQTGFFAHAQAERQRLAELSAVGLYNILVNSVNPAAPQPEQVQVGEVTLVIEPPAIDQIATQAAVAQQVALQAPRVKSALQRAPSERRAAGRLCERLGRNPTRVTIDTPVLGATTIDAWRKFLSNPQSLSHEDFQQNFDLYIGPLLKQPVVFLGVLQKKELSDQLCNLVESIFKDIERRKKAILTAHMKSADEGVWTTKWASCPASRVLVGETPNSVIVRTLAWIKIYRVSEALCQLYKPGTMVAPDFTSTELSAISISIACGLKKDKSAQELLDLTKAVLSEVGREVPNVSSSSVAVRKP